MKRNTSFGVSPRICKKRNFIPAFFRRFLSQKAWQRTLCSSPSAKDALTSFGPEEARYFPQERRRCVPVARVQRRSRLPSRSVLDGPHRGPRPVAAAETASRSRGSSRRSPNRVRRSFASGLEKDLCLPLEGRGETDSCGICWMRWKASRSHPSGRIQVKTPHQPPWRRSLNKVKRSFWQLPLKGKPLVSAAAPGLGPLWGPSKTGLRCRYGR